MKEDTILKQLFDTQAYWGHQKKSRNPQLTKFIYRTVNKIDVINLEYTVTQIMVAKSIIKQYSKDDILVLSSRGNILNDMAEISIIDKWKPGMLTNFNFGKLTTKPKLLIVDQADYNSIALKEAHMCNIKSIAFCDTNSSLKNIDQFIVINDDNTKAIKTLITYLFNA